MYVVQQTFRIPRIQTKPNIQKVFPAHFHPCEVIEDARTASKNRKYFSGNLYMASSPKLCGMNCFAEIRKILLNQREMAQGEDRNPKWNPIYANLLEHLRGHQSWPFQSLPHRTPQHIYDASCGQG